MLAFSMLIICLAFCFFCRNLFALPCAIHVYHSTRTGWGLGRKTIIQLQLLTEEVGEEEVRWLVFFGKASCGCHKPTRVAHATLDNIATSSATQIPVRFFEPDPHHVVPQSRGLARVLRSCVRTAPRHSLPIELMEAMVQAARMQPKGQSAGPSGPEELRTHVFREEYSRQLRYLACHVQELFAVLRPLNGARPAVLLLAGETRQGSEGFVLRCGLARRVVAQVPPCMPPRRVRQRRESGRHRSTMREEHNEDQQPPPDTHAPQRLHTPKRTVRCKFFLFALSQKGSCLQLDPCA